MTTQPTDDVSEWLLVELFGHYQTGIDAIPSLLTGDGMIRVIEAMEAKGFWVETFTGNGRRSCVVTGKGYHDAEAASLPLAVALAARKAIEGKR